MNVTPQPLRGVKGVSFLSEAAYFLPLFKFELNIAPRFR